MHFIQDDIFSDRHYHLLYELVKRFDLPHQIVKLIPKTTQLQFEPIDTNKVMCWGSVKLAHISTQYGWSPGSFYNENHDYRIYSKHYQENMLNYDSQILNFGDSFEQPGSLFFVRPCEDTKSFTGQVFMKHSWDDFVAFHLKNADKSRIQKDTPIQVCKLKDIHREIRTWVVKGKIITASQYKIQERVVYQECTEPYILDFAQAMVDIYQPAEAFVLDIAVTDDGLKVVEINCLNSAGFYEANLQKLLLSIEENFLYD